MENQRKTQPTKARAKPQPPPKFVGNSNIQQINVDNASAFIGSILEKGMYDDPLTRSSRLISAPQPSVLPFPVARHRSHGPHWGPIRTRSSDDHGGQADNTNGDGDQNEDHEDKGLETSVRLASFAGPVQRKEKKVLELRRWRDFMQSENPTEGTPRKELKERGGDTKLADAASVAGKKPLNRVISKDIDFELDESFVGTMNGSSEARDRGLNAPSASKITNMNLDSENQDALEVETGHTISTKDSEPICIDYQVGEVEIDNKPGETFVLPGQSVSSFNNPTGGLGHLSLDSEIDAENRARLKDMSPDEIAESQAEIMEKMNPSLLNLLKKRGMEKLKKQNISGSGSASNGLLNTTSDTQPFQNPEVSSNMKTVSNITDRQSSQRPGEMEEGDRTCTYLWSAWSERVEAIRNLRFTLDGDVLESDLDSVPGNTSGQSGESVDNVAQRDFLRTEGDPGAAGYTIKEAVALSRSVVPGQRSLALHLLASVLEKAISNIAHKQVGFPTKDPFTDHPVDWEAVWAFALGPEPELVLALRMSLDDNHSSVVSACVKVIQCTLSCDFNEHIFDSLENVDINGNDVFTAPVFRSKPEINAGFLHGGFWKYSAKSSNLLPFEGNEDEESEGKHTIQDDIHIAGQDFAAGLVRMGILPRICYLLESDPAAALEESLVSTLIAIARHSPTGASAILKCPRLIQTIVNKFTVNCSVDIHRSKVLSVRILKVLAQSERSICKEFVNTGTFQAMTWHLYKSPYSLEQWIAMGKEKFKVSAALMVEQLRFWKICIRYGYCTSYFSSIFPAMCLWLNPPTLQKLMEKNALREFCMVSKEAYLVLSALSTKLPNFRHQGNQNPDFVGHDSETWMWSYVSPMIDLAMKWIVLKNDSFVSELFEQGRNELVTSFLWVYSAILQMFFTVLDKIDPRNRRDSSGLVPWLPEFVPKIGLEIIKNGFVGSFFQQLCQLRLKSDKDTSLASVCCLEGLIRVIAITDHLIKLAKANFANPPHSEGYDFSQEGTILEKGILQKNLAEIRRTVDVFTAVVASQWQSVQSIETFSRGGPAPGVGVGWGVSGGGFWSQSRLLAQKDARFFTFLLDILPAEEKTAKSDQITAAVEASLIIGPGDRVVMEKTLDFLLHGSTLRYLGICIQNHLSLAGMNQQTALEYEEDALLRISDLLSSHFRKRWLSMKRKRMKGLQNPNLSSALETIHEDTVPNEEGVDCSTIEWAHQRLPLPSHWFLSPISTVFFDKSCTTKKGSIIQDFLQDPDNLCEIAKAGLFFVLGLEAMNLSVVKSVPLVWKLHSLSMILLLGMGVLEDEKSCVLYEALQHLFGKTLDQTCRSGHIEKGQDSGLLRFKSDIHESYPTFIETLVDQFSAESYGNVIYGRQVAVYLHRYVEASVRLAAWNALSNGRVLELLPPLEKALGAAEDYLEPAEDNDGILEAYVKSWVSGSLDRAASRGSLAFTLVLHHVSSFIFGDHSKDRTLLRNKLSKSLLRDYSRKPLHKGFLLDLIHYKNPTPSSSVEQVDSVVDIEKRFTVLTETCEGNSSLLAEVEELRFALVGESVTGNANWVLEKSCMDRGEEHQGRAMALQYDVQR